MKNKLMLLGLASIAFISFSAATSGNFTGDNSTDSFNIQNKDVNVNVSVNQFGQTIANVSSIYVDNQSSSRNFNVSMEGNVTKFLDYPSSFTLFENESGSFPLVANVPSDQAFGNYNGSLSLTGLENSNFSDSLNVSVKVFDNIKPEITESNVTDVQATKSVEWSLQVEDNLNLDSVNGNVLREFEKDQGNSTELVNETVETFSFNDTGSSFDYIFSETGTVGTYFLKVNASDESGNTVKITYSFNVDGLDSINLKTDNFVFDTFRPKDRASFELVESDLDKREFSFTLDNLSYGGNASVELGVLPPNGQSPEILDSAESRSYTEAGVYELVLIHTGSNEVEGTHSVNGELTVDKPHQHVRPRSVNVVFSGTVKNLDKPAETCTRVAEFDGCIGYSLDSVRSLFDDSYGINSSGSRDFAYLIGRVPTGDVEGSSEWGSELSLTMGQYNKTLNENQRLKAELDRKVAPFWKTLFFVLFIVSGGVLAFVYRVYPTYEFDNAKFRQKSIDKLKADDNGDDSLIGFGGLN